MNNQSNQISFDGSVSKILITILSLEDSNEPIFIKTLATRLKLTSARIGKILEKIQSDPRGILEITTKGGIGRPKKMIEINPQTIITNPLTAFLLFQMHKLGRLEVKRKEFEKKIFAMLKDVQYEDEENLAEAIHQRMSFLLAIGDIGEENKIKNIIWLNKNKYYRQEDFIKKLIKMNDRLPLIEVSSEQMAEEMDVETP